MIHKSANTTASTYPRSGDANFPDSMDEAALKELKCQRQKERKARNQRRYYQR
jgi:hypothetical protein